MSEIPDDHPRAQSLRIRHAIIEGMHNKIVAEAGLIAHGRGEAFDYLLGEQTHEFAKKAIKAAAAKLYLAKHPIISVNGNITALCPRDLVNFSNSSNIPLEINLFYRSPERIQAISQELHKFGAKQLYGDNPSFLDTLPELSSKRRVIDKRGIAKADVVFVPLEDGDRTEGLKKNGKDVITVDLNPLSRTAMTADITIVDNIIRVFPLLDEYYNEITENKAKSILKSYNNKKILEDALFTISQFWKNKL